MLLWCYQLYCTRYFQLWGVMMKPNVKNLIKFAKWHLLGIHGITNLRCFSSGLWTITDAVVGGVFPKIKRLKQKNICCFGDQSQTVVTKKFSIWSTLCNLPHLTWCKKSGFVRCLYSSALFAKLFSWKAILSYDLWSNQGLKHNIVAKSCAILPADIVWYIPIKECGFQK